MTRKEILTAIREPTDEMIGAALQTPGMLEVQDVLNAAFARRLSSPGLRWHERGEEAPLIQAWKAMIDVLLAAS